jgi:hypothetical protein
MLTLDLKLAALVAAAHKAIVADRLPLSPRLVPLRSALAKLDPGSVPQRSPVLPAKLSLT